MVFIACGFHRHSQNATIRVMVMEMIRRAILFVAALAAATPAFAIQEVVLGARAPTFAAGPVASLRWQDLPMPGSPMSFSAGAAERDPRQWAFSSGETVKMGALLFNKTAGPAWAMNGPLGVDSGFASPLFSARGFGDMGFTSRATTAIMASETLMFYTSVGQTTYNTSASIIPTPPGLALIEAPSARSDVRAGFRMELMPGLTFGAEASFSQSVR
jgi:hypothetical protein